MSRERFLVTDLTRMSPSTICIAGYVKRRDDYECVRPVFHRGLIEETWLYTTSRIIDPFSVIVLDFHEAKSDPPHIEDWTIAREIVGFDLIFSQEQRKAFLSSKIPVDRSVASIFDDKYLQLETWGAWVPVGSFCRSLGSVRAFDVKVFLDVRVDPSPRLQYKVQFSDDDGSAYRLPFTDLAAQRYCQSLIREQNLTPKDAARRMSFQLNNASMVVIRIGLARPRAPYLNRCSLLVTGIYSFPDYLDGRTHADFPRDYA